MNSCSRNNNLIPADNITGKIKSIKLILHNSPTDSSVTQYDFYYKQNGLLDSVSINNIGISVDGFSVNYNSSGLLENLYKYSNNDGYIKTDSSGYTYNASRYLIQSQNKHIETDGCFYRNSGDSSEYISGNLSAFIHYFDVIGCTPSTTYTLRDKYEFYYSSQLNSLTNENIGMPYCGISSHNVIDSFTTTNCFIQNSINSCNNKGVKAVNVFDSEGRIIKTNIIPPLSFVLLFQEFYYIMESENGDLYEISYY